MCRSPARAALRNPCYRVPSGGARMQARKGTLRHDRERDRTAATAAHAQRPFPRRRGTAHGRGHSPCEIPARLPGGGRHRRLGRGARSLQALLRRHAARQRHGLRAHPAPRPHPPEPHGGAARQTHGHAGRRSQGRDAGRAEPGVCDPTERLPDYQRGDAAPERARRAPRPARARRLFLPLAG